jgi:hypothetical protein
MSRYHNAQSRGTSDKSSINEKSGASGKSDIFEEHRNFSKG